MLPSEGDELDVKVVASKPFALIVATEADVPGLVRGARAAVGDVVRVQVTESDDVESRFSAVLA
jgi:hypothetical protein